MRYSSNSSICTKGSDSTLVVSACGSVETGERNQDWRRLEEASDAGRSRGSTAETVSTVESLSTSGTASTVESYATANSNHAASCDDQVESALPLPAAESDMQVVPCHDRRRAVHFSRTPIGDLELRGGRLGLKLTLALARRFRFKFRAIDVNLRHVEVPGATRALADAIARYLTHQRGVHVLRFDKWCELDGLWQAGSIRQIYARRTGPKCAKFRQRRRPAERLRSRGRAGSANAHGSSYSSLGGAALAPGHRLCADMGTDPSVQRTSQALVARIVGQLTRAIGRWQNSPPR